MMPQLCLTIYNSSMQKEFTVHLVFRFLSCKDVSARKHMLFDWFNVTHCVVDWFCSLTLKQTHTAGCPNVCVYGSVCE